MKKKPRFKLKRRPYKGETWDIIENIEGEWHIHSRHSHYSFMKEELEKLLKAEL